MWRPLRRAWPALALLSWAASVRAGEPDVVVVGGGPGGMAAAIEARLNGATEVVVLEKRSAQRSRVNVFAVRRGTLDNLARLGVELTRKTVMPVTSRWLDDRVTGEHRQHWVHALAPDGRRARHTVGDMTVRGVGPVGLMHISTLEEELYRAAARLGGISVRFDSEVTAVRPGRIVEVDVRDVSGKVDRVRGRVLVVADGARSTLRGLLGIGVTTIPGTLARLAGGVLDHPGDGTFEKRVEPKPGGGSAAIVRLGSINTGILAELEPGEQPADVDRVLLDAAARLGIHATRVLRSGVFDVRLDKADRVTVGDNVFVVGDAARTTHVFTGLGVNFALRDAMRFGVAYRTGRARWYARQTMRASDALHRFTLQFQKK